MKLEKRLLLGITFFGIGTSAFASSAMPPLAASYDAAAMSYVDSSKSLEVSSKERKLSFNGEGYYLTPLAGGVRARFDKHADILVAVPKGFPEDELLELYLISANSKIFILGNQKKKNIFAFDTQRLEFVYASKISPPPNADEITQPETERKYKFRTDHMRISSSGKFLVFREDMRWREVNIITKQESIEAASDESWKDPIFVDDQTGMTRVGDGTQIFKKAGSKEGPEFIRLRAGDPPPFSYFSTGTHTREYGNGNIVADELEEHSTASEYALRIYVADTDKTIKIKGNSSYGSCSRYTPGLPTVYSVGVNKMIVYDMASTEPEPAPGIYDYKLVFYNVLTNRKSEQRLTSSLRFFRCDKIGPSPIDDVTCKPCDPSKPTSPWDACRFYYRNDCVNY